MVTRTLHSLLLLAALSVGFVLPAIAQGRIANMSTRALVLTGENVAIGGIIIQGEPVKVVVRARGPSLSPHGISNYLTDPVIRLVRQSDGATLATNDNWQDAPNVAEIIASGFEPSNPLESVILATLPPGGYTAVVSGYGSATGVGIVEVFAVTGGSGGNAAGVYTGTSSAGNTVLGIVTSGGKFAFLHSPAAAQQAVVAVEMAPSANAGTTSLNTSSLTSVSPLMYMNAGGSLINAVASAKVGSFSATYSAGASLNGTSSYLPSGSLSVNTTFVPGSNTAASLAAFSGSYTGKISFAFLGGGVYPTWYASASITVSPQGVISGGVTCFWNTGPCSITGTMTPRTDLKAYDVSVAFVGGVIDQFQNKTYTGLAYLNSSTGRLTFYASNPSNPADLFAFSN